MFAEFKSAPHMGPRTLCPGQSCGVAGTDSAIPERWQASSQRNPEAGLAQMKIVKDSEEIWAAHKRNSIDFLIKYLFSRLFPKVGGGT